MDVVILCGGRGTRLSEKTKTAPKPLVEIGDYPIIWHIMKYLSHNDLDRFILTLGYKGEMIKRWFMNYRFRQSFDFDLSDPTLPPYQEKWKILFKNTGLESGTGCRLKQVREDIKSRPFLVVYGDCIADIDIPKLISFHKEMVKKKGVIATISGFQPNSKYGIINHTEDALITDFMEKPKIKEWVNIGFMVCEPQIFDYISDKPSAILEEELHGIAHQRKLALYKHTGVFHPMDTYKDYVEINALWNSGKAAWKVYDAPY